MKRVTSSRKAKAAMVRAELMTTRKAAIDILSYVCRVAGVTNSALYLEKSYAVLNRFKW